MEDLARGVLEVVVGGWLEGVGAVMEGTAVPG